MKYPGPILAILFMALSLTACETTDSSLREQGRSDAYVMGFHDGRHSGMQEEGNFLEHYIKDEPRFESDPDYRAGWLAGEAEGRSMQRAANGAVGVYSAYEIGKEVDKQQNYDKVARDAVKNVDTSELKSLEKN